ncbi:hypothetical protein AB1Y20_007928 [Prymnesium parvum]|uniref:GSCFA domain-containing protein n=1 Tax=Prymnesium parvum TaxID=97485 RepID=A0AB34ISX7_PRYPA
MVWCTALPVRPRSPPLAHGDVLLLLGSCFATDVGERLHLAGHPSLYNPLGTMFNPVSIGRTVRRLAGARLFQAEDLQWCEQQEHYFCYEAGARYTHPDAGACLTQLNEAVGRGHAQLMRSECLFLTLGSAWVYTLRSTETVVANCHRQPQQAFHRSILSPSDVAVHLNDAVAAARAVNPGIRIVLTVSPVRHWREGPVESSRSKAHLLAAAHQVVEADRDRRQLRACFFSLGAPRPISYFEAYEVIMDELRDYRWYKPDMLHPSEAAVDIVFQRLLASYFAEGDAPIRAAIQVIEAILDWLPVKLHRKRTSKRSLPTISVLRIRFLIFRRPFVLQRSTDPSDPRVEQLVALLHKIW